jgi:hypothetical protein
MTEAKGNAASTWARAAGVHLAVVGTSFVLSFVVLQGIDPFPGEAIDAMAFCVLLTHALAAVVGLLVPNASKLSCAVVFAIAFFSTGCLGIGRIKGAVYLRYYAPYDRFRDHLASPVPKSVSNLRFLSLEEQIRPDLMFEFDIDPSDMDAILRGMKLERVDPGNMLNPKDFFQHPYYMPVAGTFHVFQGRDGYDDVLTIKTNESHSHAIFRRESSNFYRDRSWETCPEIQLRMDKEALERLRRKYGM